MTNDLAVNAATLMSIPFPEELDYYRASGFQDVELWLDKITRWMTETGNSSAEVRAQIDQRGMRVIGACAASIKINEPNAQPWEQQQARLIQRLELAKSIGAGRLVTIVAGQRGRFEDDFPVLVERCRWLADQAREHGILIAMEFLARIGLVNCLSTAIRVIRDVNRSNFGLLLDLYHFWLSESRIEDLAGLPAGGLFLVHLDDARNHPIEWLTHNDRTFPGEGVIPISRMMEKIVRESQFIGPWSIELHSDWIWRLSVEDAVRRLGNSRALISTYLNVPPGANFGSY